MVKCLKGEYNMSVTALTNENFKKEVMEETKPVLIDFWATWCGPCRMLGPIIEELGEELTEVKVCKVNVDEQPDLAQQYRVMAIPTLVVLKDGKTIQTATGVKSKGDIKKMLGL